jgi:hypothetical protein
MLDVLASAALPLLGGIFGPSIVGDTGTPGEDFTSGIDEIRGIDVPGIAEQIVNWESLVQQGYLTPLEVQEIKADPSKLRDFAGTQAFKDASSEGLAALKEVAESGFSLQDKANMEEIRRRLATQEKGSREAILQNALQRGVGGSGLEMTSNLVNQQASADRSALENLMTAARGEERRLGAAERGASLGASLRGQEFGEEKAMDDAEMLINQFNAQLGMRKAEGDIGRRERAYSQNLSEAQRIADTNNKMRYEADLRNKGLIQQKYQNELNKGQAMMAGYGGKSGAKEADMNRKYRLLGGGLGGAGQILGDHYANQQKQKDWRNRMDEYKSWKSKQKPY